MDKDTIPIMIYAMQKILYITFSAIGKSIGCNKTFPLKLLHNINMNLTKSKMPKCSVLYA